MSRHRLWGFGIAALGFFGLLTWIDAFLISGWSVGLLQGLGVEVIGALLTALAVIGLDRLYAEPDAEVKALREQVDQLNAKIERLLERSDGQR